MLLAVDPWIQAAWKPKQPAARASLQGQAEAEAHSRRWVAQSKTAEALGSQMPAQPQARGAAALRQTGKTKAAAASK